VPPPHSFAARCGIEQEFYVFEGGRQVDFRDVVHSLGLPGARIDPSDRNAYRLEDGTLVTADGTEAEFATVPLLTVPGFAPGLAALSNRLYASLRPLIPAQLELRGAATHINVAAPLDRVDEIVLQYGQTFAPILQALWDRPWGEGIMIRPRKGRIEFGGEFLAGPRLAAVALFCVASVSALGGSARGLPRVRGQARPAAERLGIEWRRNTFADDFYQSARDAPVTLAAGGRAPLADLMRRGWAVARPFAEAHGTANELQTLDRIVAGELPLGIEGGSLAPLPESHQVRSDYDPTPLGRLRLNDGTTLEACVDTWDAALFRCERAGDQWFLCVPRRVMPEARARISGGDLGQWGRLPRRPLTRRSQIEWLGAFPRIPDVSLFAPVERAPGSGYRQFSLPASPGSISAGPPPGPASGPAGARPSPEREERRGKWGIPPPVPPPHGGVGVVGQPPARTRSGIPLWLVGILVLVLIAIAVGVVVALTGGGDDDTAPGSSTSPAPETPGGIAPGEPTQPLPPSATASSQSGAPSVTNSPQAAGPSPSATAAGQVAPPSATPQAQAPTQSPTTQVQPPSPTPSPTPTPTPTPVPQPVITTQVQFKQIINTVTGNCGAQPPQPGTDLSLPTPTTVVIDWQNHTIQIGDSLVSPFDPNTGFAAVTWGTGDQRRSDVIVTPNGLSGTSSFFPFWNIPQGASCQIMLTTTAQVVPGQPSLFP